MADEPTTTADEAANQQRAAERVQRYLEAKRLHKAEQAARLRDAGR